MKCLTITICVLALSRGFAYSSQAEAMTTPSQRYGQADFTEAPTQHIIPLLGARGCNGRECHGSFAGKGDFQLSLFGYDFDKDQGIGLAGRRSAHRQGCSGEQPCSSPRCRKSTEANCVSRRIAGNTRSSSTGLRMERRTTPRRPPISTGLRSGQAHTTFPNRPNTKTSGDRPLAGRFLRRHHRVDPVPLQRRSHRHCR